MLNGLAVWVTRPMPQGQVLAAEIQALGGEALCWPTIDIRAVDPAPIEAAVMALQPEDRAIFISPSAVEYAWRALMPRVQQKLITTPLLAVGQGTQAALMAHGCQEVACPVGMANSEAVLEMADLCQVDQRRVYIFRGQEGRPLLGDTLALRGAKVHYVTCYHRQVPERSEVALNKLLGHLPLDMIVATSLEGLENAINMVGDAWPQLHNTPVTVLNAAMQQLAELVGLCAVPITGARNQDIIECLIARKQG